MIRRNEHFLLAALALAMQVVTVCYTYFSPENVYGAGAMFPETWLWPLSVTVFAVSSVCGLYLTSRASYLLLTHTAYPIAASVILTVCVPAWALSVFHLHAAFVFTAVL